jgi:hypothetical protein
MIIMPPPLMVLAGTLVGRRRTVVRLPHQGDEAMMLSPKARATLAAVGCTAVGVTGGIAGAAAAPSKKAHSASTTPSKSSTARHGGPHGGFPGGGPGDHAVHSEEVVLNKAGTAFVTETEDSGTVTSISGSDVTIQESAGGVDYKTVSLTLPAGATVFRDGAKATVGDLATGDRIEVSSSSDGTFVRAADASYKPTRGDHGPPPGETPAP